MSVMTVGDLKRRLAHCHDELEVTVVLSEPSFPAHRVANVINAGQGIDWDGGRFMIYTEDKLIRKPKENELN